MCKIKDNLSYIASTINAGILPGELSQDEMVKRQAAANQAVAEHVAGCLECQAYLGRYDAVMRLAKKLAGEVAQS